MASAINDEITVYRNQNNHEIIIEDRNGGHEFPQNSIPKMIVFLKKKTIISLYHIIWLFL